MLQIKQRKKVDRLIIEMGTVLSFSPRERRPVYSTHHHSGALSSSGSADFPLNNYSYEQLNNVKNRENTKSAYCASGTNNGNMMLLGQTHNNHHLHANINHENGNNNNGRNNHINNNTINNNGHTISNNNLTNINNNCNINNNSQNVNNSERQSDSARILSEKNALEKNLKKHSLFINALSWKRLAASHSKKKLDNNKNKAANLPTATFRPPLVDAIHPLAIDKNKNIQQNQHQVYFTPGAPKALLALDLVRANNTNNAQQTDKLAPKLPLSLPLPLQNALTHSQQQHQPTSQLQHTHGPRKTVIQVSNRRLFLYFGIDHFYLLLRWRRKHTKSISHDNVVWSRHTNVEKKKSRGVTFFIFRCFFHALPALSIGNLCAH